MPAPIPCLGYPSRTAAVLALRGEGKSTAEIAAATKLQRKAVLELERAVRRNAHLSRDIGRPRRRETQTGASDSPFGEDYEILRRVRPHAAKRGLTLRALAREVLDRVAADDLFDAILDDADETRRA